MERVLRDKLIDGRFGDVSPSHSGRMRAIKAKGNKTTEKRLRAILARAGIRGWKLHPTGLPGKPDFLFPCARVVVFVDGCYWHGCSQCGHAPKVNRSYWLAKIEGNKRRNRENTHKLEEAGNVVLHVWEHELLPGQSGPFLERLRAMLRRRTAPKANRHVSGAKPRKVEGHVKKTANPLSRKARPHIP